MNKEILIRRAKAGGKARGLQERKEALLRYHTKPHFCHYCHEMIPVLHYRVADIIKKKYCNSSCAASANNKLYPARYNKKSTSAMLDALTVTENDTASLT